MINIDFLEYLVAFSKTENLSRTSETLHISQSALTRAMQKIENEIGVKLFNRSKNKLTLNETGKELVKNAKIVIDAENEMIENVLLFDNANSQISIGLTAPGPMIKYGNIFYSLFPKKSIKTKFDDEQNLINDLKNDKYDIIFTNQPIENAEIESKYIFTEELYVAVPKNHFVANKKFINFKDVDGQSFLVASEIGIWEKIINEFMPHSKFFTQDTENLFEIVNSSTIPSFATNITMQQSAKINRVYIPLQGSESKLKFYINFKKSKQKEFQKLLNQL
ncbi:MAG: LysR family transcriptional regulator [Clostridia bacterium]|nr:LysR family transcriptional regulator [Clostridia bacterium]